MRLLPLSVVAALLALLGAGVGHASGNLLANGSFEGSLAGWYGYNSSLSLANDGADGLQAALVTSSGGSDFSILPTPRPVSATTAGLVYTAGGWVRSATPGKPVCLRIREYRGTSLAGSAQQCITSTTAWLRYPAVTYTATASGNTLEVFAFEYNAASGDSFEVDGLTLADNSTPPADTTPPDTSITSGPAASTSSTSASFSFTSTESGSTFSCSLDGAAFAACTSPQAYSGLAAGSHTFQVKAKDAAGNVDPTPSSQTWTVTAADTTPPDTTITSGPASPTAATSASFAFTSTEAGSTFACSLDSAAFTACTSPQAYSGLAAGSHTFQVRATDAAGNTDPTPASLTWTIDTTPPDTTITSGPPSTSTSASASFSFTASESPTTFACSLDNAPFGTCTSPQAYSGLAAGNHTFQVRATDAAGNVDPSPASQTWTVSVGTDTTPPDTTITSGPPASTSSTSATFSFTSTEAGSTFTCSLDGGAFAACSSPQGYSGLAAGSHTFQVKAKDAAGNVDPTPASATWTIDTTPPDTSIGSGPPASTTSTSASFSFTATESPATFACALDGAAFAACSSPQSYSGLAVGSHTFQVKATDAAGNTDPTPASQTWTIGSPTPPPPPPSSGPPNDNFASAQAISTANGTTTGASTGATKEAGEPNHAGNAGGHSIWWSWTAPATGTATVTTAGSGFDTLLGVYAGTSVSALTVVASNDDASGSDRTSKVSFAVTAGATYRIAVDGYGGASGAVTLNWSTVLPPPPASRPANDDLANGQALPAASSSVTGSNVNATKESGEPSHAGNVGGASVWYSWTAPAAGSTSVDTLGSSFDTLLAVYTGSSVGGLTVVASNDDANGGRQSAVTFTAVAGTVYRIAVDGYYGSNSGLATGTVKLSWTAPTAPSPPPPPPADTTPPDTSITSGPAASTTSTSASFSFTATETPVTFACALDGAAFAACSSPQSYNGLAVGSHTFQVKATDAAGNTDPTPASQTWTITTSTTPPPPPPASDPVLAGAGDIASCTSDGDTQTARLLSTVSGTVVTLGDNAYAHGSASDFANCYDPTWGQFKSRTRPAIGNHDYDYGGSGYFNYFGAAAGDPSKGYYSYDVGAWHVIVINSNCNQVGGCQAGSAQEQWVRNDLVNHPSSCTLAYFHHPLFTSSTVVAAATFMRPIWQDLYDYGADVVLNGHAHVYERFAPQNPAGGLDNARGIREFTVGTGGAERFTSWSVRPNSEVRNDQTWGVIKLTLHPAGYDWTFAPVAGAAFTDSGSQACH